MIELERITRNLNYEVCLLGLVNVGADPSELMNVLLSSASNHPWNPAQPKPETAWEAEIDQKMLAHLPLLLHPAPRRALTVGFGSGGTSYSMSLHGIDVDCVEIEKSVPAAAEALRFCTAVTTATALDFTAATAAILPRATATS